MGNIVVTRDSQLERLESINQVENQTMLLDLRKLPVAGQEKHNMFVPASMIDSFQGENVRVYHELEHYHFYQKAKEIVLENGVSKGVVRLRRVVDGMKNSSLIASDLYVLASTFGEADILIIKHSRRELEPSHVIVMTKLGQGIMAHIDYTFSNKEYVEFEWSGIGQILEFHSDEMNPVEPITDGRLTLQYNEDSIIKYSESLESVKEEIERFRTLVGGAQT